MNKTKLVIQLLKIAIGIAFGAYFSQRSWRSLKGCRAIGPSVLSKKGPRFRRTLGREQYQQGKNEMIFADQKGKMNISKDRLAFVRTRTRRTAARRVRWLSPASTGERRTTCCGRPPEPNRKSAAGERRTPLIPIALRGCGRGGDRERLFGWGLNEAAGAALNFLQQWECRRHPRRWPARFEGIDRCSRINDDGDQHDRDTSKGR